MTETKETKVEVEDLFLRYWDHNGNNKGKTKKVKKLSSARAIIVFNNGIEQEIIVPKNENCDVSVPDIKVAKLVEVVSLLYTKSRQI